MQQQNLGFELGKKMEAIPPKASEAKHTKDLKPPPPTLPTTLKTLSVRMGINADGLDLLMKIGKKQDCIQYDEIFFNSSKMLKNVWEKEVTFINPQRAGYFETKFNLEVEGNSGEYISYYREQSQFKETTDVVAKFRVTRTIVVESGEQPTWKAYIDEVTFQDGDPHCVCSFILEENFTNTELIQKIGIFPIRSKIIEYLYRYEPAMYKQMVELGNIVAKQDYTQCITLNQAQQLEDSPRCAIIKGRIYLQMNHSQLLYALHSLLEKFENSLQKRSIPTDSYLKTVIEDRVEANYYWPEKYIYCTFLFGYQEFYVFAGENDELRFRADTFDEAAEFIYKYLQ